MFHWKCGREKEREDGHTLHHHRAQLGAIQRSDRAYFYIHHYFFMKYGIFLHGEPLVFKPSRSYHLGSWKTSVQEASRGKGVVTRWGRWAFLTSTLTIRRHMEMLMLLDDILVLSGLSCKRQRIWYCMPESHMDLEVCMRVDSLREYLNYCMITEAYGG